MIGALLFNCLPDFFDDLTIDVEEPKWRALRGDDEPDELKRVLDENPLVNYRNVYLVSDYQFGDAKGALYCIRHNLVTPFVLTDIWHLCGGLYCCSSVAAAEPMARSSSMRSVPSLRNRHGATRWLLRTVYGVVARSLARGSGAFCGAVYSRKACTTPIRCSSRIFAGSLKRPRDWFKWSGLSSGRRAHLCGLGLNLYGSPPGRPDLMS